MTTTWKKNEPTASLRRCVVTVYSAVDGVTPAPVATDFTGLVKMRAGGITLAAAGGGFTNIGGIDGLFLYEATQAETNVSVNEVGVHVTGATWYAQTLVAIDQGSTLVDGAIKLSTFAPDALIGAFGILASGTAQAGTATSITLASGASSSNSSYVNSTVLLIDGTGALQLTQATSYNGTTKVLDVADTFGTNPDSTTKYVLLASDSPQAHGKKLLEGINVEGSHKLADIFRGLLALVGGKTSTFTAGSVDYISPVDNTTVRFTITYDSNNGRIGVTIGTLT